MLQLFLNSSNLIGNEIQNYKIISLSINELHIVVCLFVFKVASIFKVISD